MRVDELQLMVLQALADRVEGVYETTQQESVLVDLRNLPKASEKFYGGAGQKEFLEVVDHLVAEGLVEQRLYKGKTHLKLTEDAVRVENLNEGDGWGPERNNRRPLTWGWVAVPA